MIFVIRYVCGIYSDMTTFADW